MHTKRVLFIRHAECLANVGRAPIITGDSALTERGHLQATHLALRLRQFPITSLHASTLVRAQETARYVEKQIGISLRVDPLYIERKYPDGFVGRDRRDADMQERYRLWEESFVKEGVDCCGGDNFERLLARAKEVVARVEQMEDAHPAIVTHGYLLRMIYAHLYLGDQLTVSLFRSFQEAVVTTNTGVSLCEIRSHEGQLRWRILSWNDHSHLHSTLIEKELLG